MTHGFLCDNFKVVILFPSTIDAFRISYYFSFSIIDAVLAGLKIILASNLIVWPLLCILVICCVKDSAQKNEKPGNICFVCVII